MKILIGTNNKGKIIEIREALDGLGIELMTPDDLGIMNIPEETGDTFEANAIEKAKFFHTKSHLPTIADDSGIIVEALKNELGIHTRRWGAGKDASDEEWISFFLDRMKGESNKRARFVCHLAYIDESSALHMFEGHCDGVITASLEAGYLPGLPISACFKPDGCTSVFSALSIEQKNSASHRGKALVQLRSLLLQPSTS